MVTNMGYTEEEIRKQIEENRIINLRKSKIFIEIIDSLPENSVWGIQEFNNEMWLHFQDWNKIKPFLIDHNKTFQFIYPDIYIQINNESKEILKEVIAQNPDSISGSYFWHNAFFKDDELYVEIFEGSDIIAVREDLGIDITGNEDLVDFL